MDIAGRTVLVTGASRGIGAATARLLADRGATVLLVARSESALAAVERAIVSGGGTAESFPVDLADDAAIGEVTAAIEDRYGTPDVIVNNAGIGRFLAIEETEPSDAAAMMEVPVLAAFEITRAFIDGMLARGSGHIVTVTSAAAFVPWPGATAYTTARWAMRGFSGALRADLRETGIGVSLVAATAVESPYWEHNPGSRERLPAIGRLFGTLAPADVARAIVRAVETERSTVLVPFRFRVAVLLARLFPGVFEWLTWRTGWRRGQSESDLHQRVG